MTLHLCEKSPIDVPAFGTAAATTAPQELPPHSGPIYVECKLPRLPMMATLAATDIDGIVRLGGNPPEWSPNDLLNVRQARVVQSAVRVLKVDIFSITDASLLQTQVCCCCYCCCAGGSSGGGGGAQNTCVWRRMLVSGWFGGLSWVWGGGERGACEAAHTYCVVCRGGARCRVVSTHRFSRHSPPSPVAQRAGVPCVAFATAVFGPDCFDDEYLYNIFEGEDEVVREIDDMLVVAGMNKGDRGACGSIPPPHPPTPPHPHIPPAVPCASRFPGEKGPFVPGCEFPPTAALQLARMRCSASRPRFVRWSSYVGAPLLPPPPPAFCAVRLRVAQKA